MEGDGTALSVLLDCTREDALPALTDAFRNVPEAWAAARAHLLREPFSLVDTPDWSPASIPQGAPAMFEAHPLLVLAGRLAFWKVSADAGMAVIMLLDATDKGKIDVAAALQGCYRSVVKPATATMVPTVRSQRCSLSYNEGM